jgi:solute carrier family 25 protein 14/30
VITFDEFKEAFALLKPVDLVRLFSRTSEMFEMSSSEMMADLAQLSRPAKAPATASTGSALTGRSADLVRMLFGGLSAVVAQSFCQPIETVKVRLQNESGLSAKRYGTFPGAFSLIVKEEGARSLWKGMAPAAGRELSYSTLRFGLYAPIKALVHPGSSPEPLWSKILAGGLAGGMGSAISNPFDLMKARMQASTDTPPKSMSSVFREIVQKDGVVGLWKGTSTTVSRAVILGSVKLASYDEIKGGLVKTGLDPKGLPIILASSVCTGLLVSAASAPADFARTRYMTSKNPDGSPTYKSGLDVVRKVVSTEGPRALYRGFFPQWARIAPYSILQFVLWEKMCAAVGIKAV